MSILVVIMGQKVLFTIYLKFKAKNVKNMKRRTKMPIPYSIFRDNGGIYYEKDLEEEYSLEYTKKMLFSRGARRAFHRARRASAPLHTINRPFDFELNISHIWHRETLSRAGEAEGIARRGGSSRIKEEQALGAQSVSLIMLYFIFVPLILFIWIRIHNTFGFMIT